MFVKYVYETINFNYRKQFGTLGKRLTADGTALDCDLSSESKDKKNCLKKNRLWAMFNVVFRMVIKKCTDHSFL